MLGRRRRLVLLAEDHFAPGEAKTAIGVLRYRPDEVVAVIDASRAGRSAGDCVGVGGEIPVVASLDAAAALGADSLLIGIAPQGGELPPPWRAIVRGALERGWDVLSGLHAFLADDAEFAAAARRGGATVHDVRRPLATRPVAAARAATLDSTVVLTVGSDCNVGKMTAALELRRELAALGVRAAFVATGQTGIFVADQGAAVDAIPADFVAGVVEELVVAAARDADFVLVEGQGSLHHPGYSGVTLALLHGAAPAALVLCHQSGRDLMRCGLPGEPLRRMATLPELVLAYEAAAAWIHPARVVGVTLHTGDLGEPASRAACERAAHETGLPATDPVRFGSRVLAEALIRFGANRRPRATAS
ncbi:MAG: DUF1611 domain-containing protein [Candidatus Eisenbacteria bacterium]